MPTLADFTLLDLMNMALALGCAYVSSKIALRLAHAPDNEDLTTTVIRLRGTGLRILPAILTALRTAETRALICGLVTVVTGSVGYVLGTALGRWQASFDLLLFGGMLALLLASRRQVEARSAQSLLVTASVWTVFLLTVQRVSV